jgi:hypothetical protein
MARRFPAWPLGRPVGAGVVVAVLLVAALILAGRSFDGAGRGRRPATGSARTGTASTQAPHHIGARTECPPRWPVLAMSNHRSYPPGHPGRPPPGVTAVACYQTAASAAGAGYARAPLPASVLEVDGVYLAPTSSGFRSRCQQVADRIDFAVPCPELLPTLAAGVPPPRLCDQPFTCRRGLGLRFQWNGFQVPPGYVGPPGGYGTLDIAAGPTHRLALPCPNQRRIATPTVHQNQAVLAACPEEGQLSSYGGLVLLRWSQRGLLVEVGVLGWSQGNQRLVVAVADHLRLVEPAG